VEFLHKERPVHKDPTRWNLGRVVCNFTATNERPPQIERLFPRFEPVTSCRSQGSNHPLRQGPLLKWGIPHIGYNLIIVPMGNSKMLTVKGLRKYKLTEYVRISSRSLSSFSSPAFHQSSISYDFESKSSNLHLNRVKQCFYHIPELL
jgi:hypothetical protein